jgi:hypothetical protein
MVWRLTLDSWATMGAEMPTYTRAEAPGRDSRACPTGLKSTRRLAFLGKEALLKNKLAAGDKDIVDAKALARK